MNRLLLIVGLVAIAHAHFIPAVRNSGRIINGDLVAEGEIPHQVSIQDSERNFHFCGGSVISKKTVLTAAHCVVQKTARKIKVIAGVVNLENSPPSHRVQDIIAHEKFDFKTTQNDIALLVIVGEFEITSKLNLVPLATDNHISAGSRAIVSGWGVTKEGSGLIPDHLQKAEIFIVERNFCKKQYEAFKLGIFDTHICALNPFEQKGACNGDSGGPLTINGFQYGVVSWSVGCASTTYPSVYTAVPKYIDWIEANAV